MRYNELVEKIKKHLTNETKDFSFLPLKRIKHNHAILIKLLIIHSIRKSSIL